MRRFPAIAALCLALALVASAQLRIVLRDGAVKGNRYSNPSIGVSYEFPHGWQAETPPIPAQLTADPITLLKAHPAGAADPRWVAMQITALSRLPQEQRDPEKFLANELRTFDYAGHSAQMTGPLQKAELGDHEFERADIVLTAGERHDPMVLFAGAVNGFMFVIQALAADPAQLGELADTADSMRFFPPDGTEEQQPVVPVPLHDEPTAVKRVSVPETTARAHLRRKVEPEYPADARARGVEGEVLIDLVIGADGHVLQATVVSGHPLLNDAALAATKQWTFDPYVLNGRAVEIATRIRVTFSLISAKTAS
jgi:TonB family protein